MGGPRGNIHSMWFHIPSNVNCPGDRCTVQFTWKTANSCNPHPAAYCNYYHHVVGPQNTDCSTNAWCEVETYVTWCPAHAASVCPTPQCMVKGTSGPEPATPATTSKPEPEPELEPEPEPEPETDGVTCKATPGLNRGVSDSACA